MPGFGKPNATGRSSGKRTGRAARAHRPPKDEPWVWLTRELVSSPAWRSRSINCARLIDFLMVEHKNHAGTENGNLMATYDQLVPWGLTRSEIRAAIDEAEFLGLVRFERGGRWAETNKPSTCGAMPSLAMLVTKSCVGIHVSIQRNRLEDAAL